MDTWGILGIWDLVVQEADGSDNFTSWFYPIFSNITWITDHKGSSCGLVTASDSGNLAFFVEEDLINVSVEHVGSTVDGTES